jgi:hypothetical protein
MNNSRKPQNIPRKAHNHASNPLREQALVASCIKIGDIKTGFENDAGTLESMLLILSLNVKNMSCDQKLIELLDQYKFAGKLFVVTVDLHHAKIDRDVMQKSFDTILLLYKYQKMFNEEQRDPDLVRSCSRLIAKLAKIDPDYGNWVKFRYELKCDLKKTSEQKIVELIRDLKFTN